MIEPSGPRADFFPRLGGWIIDLVLINALSYIARRFGGFAVGLPIALIVGVLYTVPLVAGSRGQTVGMWLCGTRVIDAATGGRVSYGQAVLRYFVGLLSLLPLGAGYFWMLVDPERRTWHDIAARTVAVPIAFFPAIRPPAGPTTT
ncbi:MAG: hypothetical protein JWL73_3480 [Actinomycetia bacterium]|nr:hypothetical protein [Actinomycetes bacterium]